jgi:hypothetical protein
MSKSALRVFREGKGTHTALRAVNGAREITLERPGEGSYLPGELTELSEAEAFCRGELQKDPAAILHIVADRLVLDTLWDREYYARKNRKDGIIYAVVSTAVVLIISLCVSLFVMPFTSTHAHALFTLGMALLYLGLLFVSGPRNIHALLMIGLILIMAIFLAPAIRELVTPDKAPVSASKAAPPQH